MGLLPSNALEEVDRLLRESTVPVCAIALIRDGRLATSRTFGAPRRGTAGPGVFEAASLVKPVLAVVCLQLRAEGFIDLNRPLVEYCASPSPDPRAREITARHVLSHSSGLPNWPKGGEQNLVTNPGERFTYSSAGYDWLARAVEQIMGARLESLYESRVFRPLAMGDSSVPGDNAVVDRLVRGHTKHGEPLERGLPTLPRTSSLYTTAADYGRFIAACLRSRSGDDSLGGSRLDGLFEPVTVAARSVEWSLGLGLAGEGSERHFFQWGDNPGYKHIAIGWMGTGDGLVVLTNGDDGVPLYLRIVELFSGNVPAGPRWIGDGYRKRA